jgi:chromosome segregation ATPase
MVKKKRKTTGKSSVTLSLTSQAHDRLAEMAQKSGFSRSAFVESVLAGKVAIAAPDAEQQLAVVVEDESSIPPKLQIAVVESTDELASIAAPSADNSNTIKLAEKIAEQSQVIAALQAEIKAKNAVKPTALQSPQQQPEIPSIDQKKIGQEVAVKDEKIVNLTATLQRSQSQVKILEEEVRVSAKNLVEQQEIRVKLERTLAQETQAAKENQTQNKILEKQLEEQYSRVSELAREVAQQQEKGQLLSQLESRLQQANKQGDRLKQQLSNTEVVQQKLQSELDAAATTRSQLQSQLSTADLEKTGLQQQLLGTKALEENLRLQKATLAELETALYAERQLVNSLQTQLESVGQLKQDYAALQTQYRVQGDRLTALEAKANQLDGASSIGERYLSRWKKY